MSRTIPAGLLPEGTMARAVLIRHVPVRMVEVSASGCLLESRSLVQAGAAGELRVAIAGEMHADPVRLNRCVVVEGSGSPFRLGAEFLWTDRPGTRSLRLAARGIQDAATSECP